MFKPPFLRITRCARVALLGLACITAAHTACAAELWVSAAASLGNALREVAPLYERAHPGTQVVLNTGASGALLTQIAKGAPVDIFISADTETMDQAHTQGLLRPGLRRDVAANTLVVVVPAGRTAQPPQSLDDLNGTAVQRVAIGNPASVPAGRYARAALERQGLWKAMEPRLVNATHVRQALDYVARGEAQAGFVYATDAALMPDRVRVAFTVPTAQPIRYPAAVMARAPNPSEAARWLDFLLQPAAQAVLARHGFSRP